MKTKIADEPDMVRWGVCGLSELLISASTKRDTLHQGSSRGCGRVVLDLVSTRVKVRPKSENALAIARQIEAHAPYCGVILTVYEMKWLGRDAAELTALADHLTAHGLMLEMLARPLAGIYYPAGPGKMLFAFFAAMAETERETILEGRDAVARKGKHGGRPTVVTDEMIHTVLRRKAVGESWNPSVRT
ncbi:recombinase family protein [Streptomyces sp. NPDC048483]|uniref:recombinase family protein n=1 Tax=Streptomyces sp. NPDC048483 TaxID=3154927 RepID=UPI00342CAA10